MVWIYLEFTGNVWGRHFLNYDGHRKFHFFYSAPGKELEFVVLYLLASDPGQLCHRPLNYRPTHHSTRPIHPYIQCTCWSPNCNQHPFDWGESNIYYKWLVIEMLMSSLKFNALSLKLHWMSLSICILYIMQTIEIQEGSMVALLTEAPDDAPWLARVKKVEGDTVRLVWLGWGYNTKWRQLGWRWGGELLTGKIQSADSVSSWVDSDLIRAV